MTKKEEKQRMARYKMLMRGRDYAEVQFDKLIIYLSAGGIVTSITFIDKLIKLDASSNFILIKISWTLFTLTLILMVVSHKTSRAAHNYEIANNSCKGQILDSITKKINWVSFIFLLIGLILFGTFVLINI